VQAEYIEQGIMVDNCIIFGMKEGADQKHVIAMEVAKFDIWVVRRDAPSLTNPKHIHISEIS
jgi:hypothetical protein